MATMLLACGSKKETNVPSTLSSEPLEKQEYFKIPVKHFKEENAVWWIVSDWHNDSATAVKAYVENDSTAIKCLFFTGFRFSGSKLPGGNDIYTVLPGYGEVYFKLNDVQREKEE